MPFIGKNPTAGFATIVKDTLTPNGSTTQFTLSKQVASPTDIAVFVGNVRQEPTTAYTVNGTTLDFGSGNAPATGLDMYVLHIGGTQEVSTVPADGTITSAKLQSNAVTSAKIANNTVTTAHLHTGFTLASSKLTGALPALDGSALTNLTAGYTFTSSVDVSGSAYSTFTGIPSDVTNIRVLWFGYTPGSGYPEWRLGHSGGNITTGYFNHQHYDSGGGSPATSYSNNVNSFRLDGWTATNNTWYGVFDFTKQVHTNGNNYWHMHSGFWNSGYTTYSVHLNGFVNAGTNVIDRYYTGSSNGSNITGGNIQVGYI